MLMIAELTSPCVKQKPTYDLITMNKVIYLFIVLRIYPKT